MKYTKQIDRINDVEWQFASRNVDDDFHTDIIFLRVSTGTMEQVAGIKHKKALLHYKGFTGQFYYPEEDTKTICKFIINRILSDRKWRNSINSSVVKLSDELGKVFNCYQHLDGFSNLTNKEIAKIYKLQLNAQIALYSTAWICEVFQSEKYGLTNYLHNYLVEKERDDKRVNRAFIILTTSDEKSIYVKENEELLRIADKILSSRSLAALFKMPFKYLRPNIPSTIRSKIVTLADRYGYLEYHGYGVRKRCTYDDYLQLLFALVNKNDEQLTRNLIVRDAVKDRVESSQLRKQYDIDHNHWEVFKAYGEFAISKAYRRLAQLKNFYFLDKLISEIAMRFDVPEKIIRFMTPEEIIAGIAKRRRSYRNIEARSAEMIYFTDNGEETITTGVAVKSILNNMHNISTRIRDKRELKGLPACNGKVTGRAIVLERKDDKESLKFRKGDIIVSVESDPDLIMFMRQAGGIITDQGGITSHAAIVAREFNVPCVTGTQEATTYIKTGDIIQLDADSGIILIMDRAPQVL